MQTSTALATARPATHAIVLPSLAAVDAQVQAFAENDLAPRTRAEYAAQWHAFTEWCGARQLCALPCAPLTLARYITERVQLGLSAASLNVLVPAIVRYHREAGVPDDELPHQHAAVKRVRRGIRRTVGVAARRVAPAQVDVLQAMVAGLPDALAGKRDRALLVLGFAGAFRRSELVALQVADVEFRSGGLLVTVRRSKTDQEARGVVVDIPYGAVEQTCPVRTLRAWLDVAGITAGPLFRRVYRSGRVGPRALYAGTVADIVKQRATAAGLDASQFSGHSLRSGLATSAAKAGKDDRAIMRQGRWTGRAMVDRYVRDAEQFSKRNAAANIGL